MAQKSKKAAKSKKVAVNLRRQPSGILFCDVKINGRWTTRSTRTRDVAVAKRIQLAWENDEALRHAGLKVETLQSADIVSILQPFIQDLRMRGRTEDYVKDTEEGVLNMLKRVPVAAVSDLTRAHIREARDEMLEEGLSHRSVNKEFGYLRNLLRWAEREELIGRNPVNFAGLLPEKPENRTFKRRALTLDECRRLLSAARTVDRELNQKRPGRYPQTPVLEIAIGTGFRLGEIVGLTWGDIIQREGRAWLSLSSRLSKNSEPRLNPLPEWLWKRLQDLKRTHLEIEYPGVSWNMRPREPDSGSPIAPKPTGGPCPRRSTSRLRDWFYVVLKRACIPVETRAGKIDIHALRMTYNVLMAEAGVDLGVRMVLMGHKTIGMTAKDYGDSERLPKVEAVEAIRMESEGGR